MSVYSDKVHKIAGCIEAHYKGMLKPGSDTAVVACDIIRRCSEYDTIKNALDRGMRDSSMIDNLGHTFPHGVKSAKMGKTFWRKRPTLTVIGRTEAEKIDDLNRFDFRDALIELMETEKGDIK